MEKFFLDREIKVAYIAAVSFPEGLGAAYKQLHETFPDQCKIAQYGISFGGPNRSITYWAAVEATSEAEKIAPGLPTFTLKKGLYVSKVLNDWKQDETKIGRTFRELLQAPALDPKGYCLEIYDHPTDVRCCVLVTE